MRYSGIGDLHEPDVDIEGKFSDDDDRMKRLWEKNQLIFRRLCDLNRPLIVTGKQCMDYAHGDIFDPATRSIYEDIQNKICIEPRVLKQRMNFLVGTLLQAVRTGKIASESVNAAEEVYAANVVLKFVEKEIGERQLLTQMLYTGCLTGYPQVLLFDTAQTSYGDQLGGLAAELLPWDAVVFNRLSQTDGSDLTDLVYIARKTEQELIDENPDRESDIKKHFKKLRDENRYNLGYGESYSADSRFNVSIDDERYLNYDVVTATANFLLDGRLLCLQRFSIQKVKAEVAIKSTEDGSALDTQILPPAWSDMRKQQWKKEHPEYRFVKKDTKLLWSTRWTSCGLVLKNEPHDFQESDNKGNPIFPCAVFVPQILDGKPTGPGPDDRLLVLMKAVAETEQLHDIRTGSGDILAYKQGAVVNHEELPTELSIGNGIVVVDPEVAPGAVEDSVKFLKRTANTTYGNYSERVDLMLDNTDGLNPAVRGQAVGARVSGKANQDSIAQLSVGYSVIAENMNRTFERIKNLECMLIPYCMTEEQVLQVYDDDRGEEVAVTVNEEGYDENGQPFKVANDLSSVKWRWRLTEGDDSPTAKQAELNEMLIFWNTTAPALIDADESLSTLASVLVSMGNKMAKQVGQVIAEKADVRAQQMDQQQMMETMANLEEKKAKAAAETTKAKRAGFSFSITPEDLATIPGLYKVLVDADYINQQNNAFQNPGGANAQQTA